MKPHDGLHVSLLEESLLVSSGVLSGAPSSPEAYGLTDESVRLFLLIAAAGDDGLPQSKIPQELRKDLNAHLVTLELQGLVAWERDNRGRLSYLVLTWKGSDALAAAKPVRQEPKSKSNARRRALRAAA